MGHTTPTAGPPPRRRSKEEILAAMDEASASMRGVAGLDEEVDRLRGGSPRTRHDELAARFDEDPDAIEWARGKISQVIDRAERFQRHATESGNPKAAEKWRFTAAFMRQSLLGGEGCVIAHFDRRLPHWLKALKASKGAGS